MKKKALRDGNITRMGEIVRYSTKTYRKSREMNVMNHEKIVCDDNIRDFWRIRAVRLVTGNSSFMQSV